MYKKLLFTLVILFFSIKLFSQQDVKFANLEQNQWVRVVQHNSTTFTIDKLSQYSTLPSFIVTKNTELTKNGYLHRVWVTSNVQINGAIKNIELRNVKILVWDGKLWRMSFFVEWIIVGNVATQIHYFFFNAPEVQTQIFWENIKIK